MLAFDFLDRPDPAAIESALVQLYLLEAIDSYGRVSSLGKELVKFPLEPTYAKSLLAAKFVSKQCAVECCKLFAILSTENIWSGVSKFDSKRQQQLQDAKETFRNPKSDHLALVNIFDSWRQVPLYKQSQWCFAKCLQHRALA